MTVDLPLVVALISVCLSAAAGAAGAVRFALRSLTLRLDHVDQKADRARESAAAAHGRLDTFLQTCADRRAAVFTGYRPPPEPAE